MPAEAYTFNGFPEEVIAVIAGYSEELAIWRLMATSRAVRNAAQPALQPHVAKQVLIAPLPYGTELFEPIPKSTLDRENARYTTSRELHERFHPIISSAVGTFVRDLQLEVRDDDREAGWNTLRRTATYLTQLDIFILDRFRTQPAEWDDPWYNADYDDSVGEEEDSDDEKDGGGRPDPEAWGLWWEGTPDYLEDWSGVLGTPPVRFSNLTKLTMTATSRGLHHLHQLAQLAPNLGDLTWKCDWGGEFTFGAMDGPELSATFPSLVSLAVIAHPMMTVTAALNILRCSPRLRSLLLHIPNPTTIPNIVDNDLVDLVRLICQRKGLTRLGLYGGIVDDFLHCVHGLQAEGPSCCQFAHLRSLALERQYEEDEELMDDEGEMPNYWPLLEEVSTIIPRFPELKHLTFLDRQTFNSGAFTLGALDATGYTDFFDSESCLQGLFRNYPSLQRIQWIAGLPLDPFSFTKATRAERNVKCVVSRSAGSTMDSGLPLATGDQRIKLRKSRAPFAAA